MSRPVKPGWTRKAGKILLVASVLILGGAAGLVAWLGISSPGTPAPLLDTGGKPAAGGLSEKLRVRIGGVDQGLFLRSRDPSKPVLLFVHGGPGMPEYAIARTYPEVLEQEFTVCWWDQRGAGLSYSDQIRPESLTVDRLVRDTLEVADYLRARFGQDKIFLLGHSWGSFLGLQAVARAPEKFRAYLGMGQMVRYLESERLAFEYLLRHYRQTGDTALVRRLESAPVTGQGPLPEAYAAFRDEAMHRAGIGTTRAMDSVVTGIFLPVMGCPEYTLAEKINLWRGRALARRAADLETRMQETDLELAVPEVKVPVYLLHGAYDYTCAYPLAQEFLKKLRAPAKGFYTFGRSAHTPLFEEPEAFLRILREDVLKGRFTEADAG